MSLDDLKPIWTWLNDVAEITAIWSDQSHEQPALPYAMLNILSVNKIGAIDERRYDGDELTLVGPRSMVVAVHVYDQYDSASILEDALSRLDLPEIRADLYAGDIGVLNIAPQLQANIRRSPGWLKHSVSDITFSLASNIVAKNQDYFDRIVVTGELDGESWINEETMP